MEEFDYRGTWWHPESPECVLSGQLTFSFEEGLHLDLDGILDNRSTLDSILGSFSAYPLVHGRANRQAVTLIQAQTVSQGVSQNGGVRSALAVATAIFGLHLPYQDQVRTTAAAFQFGHLRDWAQLSGLTQRITTQENEKYPRFETEYVAPQSIVATIPNASFQIHPGFSNHWQRFREYRITESVGLKVVSDRALTIDEWFSEFILPIKRLIDLATGVSNKVNDLRFYFLEDEAEGEASPRSFQTFHSRAISGVAPDRSLSMEEMLFTLSDIKDDIPMVLERWRSAVAEIDTVLNLIFDARFEGNLPLEERFFSLVRALESYHRNRVQELDVDEEDHFSRIDMLLVVCQR